MMRVQHQYVENHGIGADTFRNVLCLWIGRKEKEKKNSTYFSFLSEIGKKEKHLPLRWGQSYQYLRSARLYTYVQTTTLHSTVKTTLLVGVSRNHLKYEEQQQQKQGDANPPPVKPITTTTATVRPWGTAVSTSDEGPPQRTTTTAQTHRTDVIQILTLAFFWHRIFQAVHAARSTDQPAVIVHTTPHLVQVRNTW